MERWLERRRKPVVARMLLLRSRQMRNLKWKSLCERSRSQSWEGTKLGLWIGKSRSLWFPGCLPLHSQSNFVIMESTFQPPLLQMNEWITMYNKFYKDKPGLDSPHRSQNDYLRTFTGLCHGPASVASSSTLSLLSPAPSLASSHPAFLCCQHPKCFSVPFLGCSLYQNCSKAPPLSILGTITGGWHC